MRHNPTPRRARHTPGRSYRSAYDFFRKHAGGIVGESARTAKELADAESWARSRGVDFHWQDDPDADLSFVDTWPAKDQRRWREQDHVVEGVVAETRGRYGIAETSLWGIVDADRDYRRLVEAELALELRAGMDHNRPRGASRNPRPRLSSQRAMGARIRAAAKSLSPRGRAIGTRVAVALLTRRVVRLTQGDALELERALAAAGQDKAAATWRLFLNSIGKSAPRARRNPQRGGKQLTGQGSKSDYYLAVHRPDRALWYLYVRPGDGALAYSGDVGQAGTAPRGENSLRIRGLDVARRWVRGRRLFGDAAKAYARGERLVIVDAKGRVLEGVDSALANSRKRAAAPKLLELDYFEIVKRFGDPKEVTQEQAMKVPAGRRWTLVDSDSGALLTSGMHFVNRLDYYVTPRAVPAGVDVVELPDDDDEYDFREK